MKMYNKILEAIQQGIQLALDDFDDDQVQNIKSKQVQNRDYTKEYLDLMKEVVDLDLPSKTLWCKYNLDVKPNQLNKPKDWYGKQYAWGELEGNKIKNNKIYFDWDNYKFGKEYVELTKYCNNPEYGLNGFTDNLTELLPEEDAAYQNKKLYNFKFHIPTKEQLEELLRFTQNYWVNDYNPNNIEHHINDDGINGLNGRVFIGQNGNQLFIPAAGYRDDQRIYSIGSSCYLWSSSIDLGYPYGACHLHFNLDNISLENYYRCKGFSVRPVINL